MQKIYKRLTIQEIKKHPFFLKGKKIFEKNFTIYQVTSDDIIDSDNSSSIFDLNYLDDNIFINNLLYYDSKKKKRNYF